MQVESVILREIAVLPVKKFIDVLNFWSTVLNVMLIHGSVFGGVLPDFQNNGNGDIELKVGSTSRYHSGVVHC